MRLIRSNAHRKFLLLGMSRLLGDSVEIIINFEFVSIDLAHRRRRHVLTIRTVEVAVERRLIKVAVFGLVENRFTIVGTSDTRTVMIEVDLIAALAILRHQFDAFLVHVVVTVIALHALFEQPAEKFFAELTNRRSCVRVHLKGVRYFHSRYRSRAAAI